jgi:hypothetical protein
VSGTGIITTYLTLRYVVGSGFINIYRNATSPRSGLSTFWESKFINS